MSLRPIKSSRRRKNPHPRLQTSGQWNFSWKPIQRFDPVKHKRLILALFIIGILGFGIVWSTDQNNPLFHSMQPQSQGDPQTNIWIATVEGTQGFAPTNFNSINAIIGASGPTNLLSLRSNSTFAAIAVSKSSFDLSVISAKELLVQMRFQISLTGTLANLETAWYLTRNSTLPLTPGYDPFLDSSVAMIFDQGSAFGALYLQRDITLPINYDRSCAGAGACYINGASTLALGDTNDYAMINSLNYTGATASGGANGKSSISLGNGPVTYSSTTLPWFAFQSQPYYLGFWSRAGTNTPFANWEDSAGGAPSMTFVYYVPTAGLIPAQIDTGGFFGPVIKALINIGVFILNAVLGFIAFITPALQAALNFLEGILVTALNGLGNALGLGNVGTTLQTFINAVITFFTNGQFGNIISNFPTAISRLIDVLTVYFPWLAQAILIGAQVATFLVKGVGFTLTVLSFATTIGIGASATFLIVMFFVYTGDNSLGGVLEFWQTTLWLVVGLGLKFLIHLTNFILDVVTAIIGVIPKPFIQMVAHALPRLPLVNTEASFVPPSGLMGEIKNGNLFSVALWISGILFLDLYESASPALPGSIGALLPATAGKLTALTGLIPLLEIMTVLVWMAALFIVPIGWFANAMDLGFNLPVESSLGNRPQTHFGIRVSRAEKHNNLRGSVRGFREAFRRSKPYKPAEVGENIN